MCLRSRQTVFQSVAVSLRPHCGHQGQRRLERRGPRSESICMQISDLNHMRSRRMSLECQLRYYVLVTTTFWLWRSAYDCAIFHEHAPVGQEPCSILTSDGFRFLNAIGQCRRVQVGIVASNSYEHRRERYQARIGFEQEWQALVESSFRLLGSCCDASLS